MVTRAISWRSYKRDPEVGDDRAASTSDNDPDAHWPFLNKDVSRFGKSWRQVALWNRIGFCSRKMRRHKLHSRTPPFVAFVISFTLVVGSPWIFTTSATGNNPYSQWPNGPSTNPNFFPIGVWLQRPSHAQEFKDIGINMFVGFSGSLDRSSLRQFASARMPLIPDQNSVGLTSPQNNWIQGWEAQDEPDNAQSNRRCVRAIQVVSAYSAIKANDRTRPVFLNFGRGVSDINWVGRGTCTGDTSYYPSAIRGGDIISFDIYPVAFYDGRLEMVPQGVDNLRKWVQQAGGSHVIWNFIEGAAIKGGAAPTYAQLEAEVWMSLIHGSQGIIYFVHQFSPKFREDGIFNSPTVVRAVTSINSQITSLAPVLNSPTITNDTQVASSARSTAPISMMEKRSEGSIYIFAVEMRNNTAVARFTTPAVQSGTVNVLNENRQLSIVNGKFQDNFNGYGVHLYQFGGGAE
jgi:hypothetical protein